ncbi:hypothetical protein F5B17DRAFT_448996 [Nemania serpens]|nr:hypothetical protein F5B17DRAFT_448996 [Nemania serpens]
METQLTEILGKLGARAEGDKLIVIEARTETIKSGTKEAKEQGAKTTAKRPLPFDPAKARAAAKSKKASISGTKKPGAKPRGVTKLNSAKAPGRNLGTSVDEMLAATRRWLTSSSYIIRNPETGCFGLSSRERESERAEISVVHTADCECLDVRLMHVCQHADRLVKRRRLARRSRDAFVIATKICRELPLPIPKATRFPPLKKQVIRRREEEVEAETEVRYVVEAHNQQRLVEKCKNLEAYKARLIWKDW